MFLFLLLCFFFFYDATDAIPDENPIPARRGRTIHSPSSHRTFGDGMKSAPPGAAIESAIRRGQWRGKVVLQAQLHAKSHMAHHLSREICRQRQGNVRCCQSTEYAAGGPGFGNSIPNTWSRQTILTPYSGLFLVQIKLRAA
jgi:hypothetical protein